MKTIGGVSKPSISRPDSSLMERLNGPSTRLLPLSRSQNSAADSSLLKISASSSATIRPKCPIVGSFTNWSICALMRPTSRPSRTARKYWASACSKYGLRPGDRASRRSISSCGTKFGSLAYSRAGRRMKRISSALLRTGTIDTSLIWILPPSASADRSLRCSGTFAGGQLQEADGREYQGRRRGGPPRIQPPAGAEGREHAIDQQEPQSQSQCGKHPAAAATPFGNDRRGQRQQQHDETGKGCRERARQHRFVIAARPGADPFADDDVGQHQSGEVGIG